HLGGQFLGGGLFFPALLGAVGRCAGVVGLSVGCVGEVAGWWFLETLATGFTDAQDGVEGQLCGLADDLGGLRRVLHTGQFDDDPVLTGTRHVRLGHAQAVDALAQHLQDLVGVVGVGDRAVGTVLGLQDDLGAAAQVESQAGRYEPRRTERDEDDEQGDEGANPAPTSSRITGQRGYLSLQMGDPGAPAESEPTGVGPGTVKRWWARGEEVPGSVVAHLRRSAREPDRRARVEGATRADPTPPDATPHWARHPVGVRPSVGHRPGRAAWW